MAGRGTLWHAHGTGGLLGPHKGGKMSMHSGRSRRLLYRSFVALAVSLNLVLGLVILVQLRPVGWLGDLELSTGAFCCAVAGWLTAAAWGRSYWGAAMARQVRAWSVMVDAIFVWLEDTPLPRGALQRLEVTLDKAKIPARSTAS